MIEGPAEHKQPDRKVQLTIAIPHWVLQVAMLVLIIVSATLIAFFGYTLSAVPESSAKVGACVIIIFIQLFSFALYRSFLRRTWGVEPN